MVGFCFLDLASNYEPPQELVTWLKAGPKPIYIGFGSLVSLFSFLFPGLKLVPRYAYLLSKKISIQIENCISLGLKMQPHISVPIHGPVCKSNKLNSTVLLFISKVVFFFSFKI